MEKRAAYAGLGIPEYWRFDETGDFHGTRLAGDRLETGWGKAGIHWPGFALRQADVFQPYAV